MVLKNENVTIFSQNHNYLKFHRKAIFLESQLCVITSHLKRTKKNVSKPVVTSLQWEAINVMRSSQAVTCRRILLVSRLCSIWVHFKYEE